MFVLLGAALALVVLLGAVLLVARGGSDDDGGAGTPEQAASPAEPDPYEECQFDMSRLVTGLADDLIAGYQNLDGPNAQQGGATYGQASDFFVAAYGAAARVWAAYQQGGAGAAVSAVPGEAERACTLLLGERPANSLPDSFEEPSAGASDPGCTGGVSYCAFDNGIDFQALYADIGSQFGVDAEAVSCDLQETPPNQVAVGESFYCSIDSSRYPAVAVLVTADAPFYSVDAAPVSGD